MLTQEGEFREEQAGPGRWEVEKNARSQEMICVLLIKKNTTCAKACRHFDQKARLKEVVCSHRSVEGRKGKKPPVCEDRSDPFCPGPPCGSSAPTVWFDTQGDVIRLSATKPVTPQRSDAFTRKTHPRQRRQMRQRRRQMRQRAFA